MRTDTICTLERTLGALASAIKGTVIGSMKKGRHKLVKNIVDAANEPDFNDRVMIYDGSGRSTQGLEKKPAMAVWIWTSRLRSCVPWQEGTSAIFAISGTTRIFPITTPWAAGHNDEWQGR
jgi:hypothetical protein